MATTTSWPAQGALGGLRLVPPRRVDARRPHGGSTSRGSTQSRPGGVHRGALGHVLGVREPVGALRGAASGQPRTSVGRSRRPAAAERRRFVPIGPEYRRLA